MANARSIIEAASRKIQVLGRGQTLSAQEAQNALEALNGLLGMFSAQAGTIVNNVRESFNLNGATSYTIGIGGDFNTDKPVDVTAAFVRIGSTDYTLKQINAAEYAAIGFKAITGIPELFYYENNTPLGRMFLYPVAPSYQLNIYSLKALTSFADLTTDYDMPEGMFDMLVYNLAVAIAPEYEKACAMLEPHARFVKVDTEAHQEVGAQHNIRSIPTLAIFKGGKEVSRISGARSASDLAKWIQPLIAN